MKNNEGIIIAFVAGAALGALAGILFAPHKGSKTREILKEEGRKMADNLRGAIDDGLEKLSSMKDEILDTLHEAEDSMTKENG